jgi:NAD-dependent SIR2 family protein deacetylase
MTAAAPRPRKRRKVRRTRKPKKCPVCHMPADRRTAANVVALHGHNWHSSCLSSLVTVEAYDMALRHQQPRPADTDLYRKLLRADVAMYGLRIAIEAAVAELGSAGPAAVGLR